MSIISAHKIENLKSNLSIILFFPEISMPRDIHDVVNTLLYRKADLKLKGNVHDTII